MILVALAARAFTSKRSQAQAIAKMTTTDAPNRVAAETGATSESSAPERHTPHLRLAVIRPPPDIEVKTGARAAFGPLPASAPVPPPFPEKRVENPLMAAALRVPPPPAASESKLAGEEDEPEVDSELKSTTTPTAPKPPPPQAHANRSDV